MESQSRRSASAFVAIALSLLIIPASAALNYCSTQNVGVGGGSYARWQSNGWCTTHCQDSYAVAIVQDQYCWCSDYLPADQTDLSDCDEKCPGYPTDDCGSANGVYFGYLVLGDPSGTVTPSSAQPTPTSSSSIIESTSSSTPITHHHKTKPSPQPVVTSSSSFSPVPTTHTELTSKTTMMTSTNVVTSGGTVITHTIVQTSLVAVPADKSNSDVQSSGTPTGAIVGGVIGGVGGLALIVGGALWFLLRQRRKEQSEYAGSDTERSSGVTRNTSVLSKTGLLGTREKPTLPPIHTGRSRSTHGLDMESVSPSSDRRNSRPIFYDQRLNPSALMDNETSSRASIGTMQDNRDYTRTLNVRNPDPDAETIDEPDHNHQAHVR